MFEFIELAKFYKFMFSLFVPMFGAFVTYFVVSLAIDFFRRSSND